MSDKTFIRLMIIFMGITAFSTTTALIMKVIF